MDEAFNARLHKISREKSGSYYSRLLKLCGQVVERGFAEVNLGGIVKSKIVYHNKAPFLI